MKLILNSVARLDADRHKWEDACSETGTRAPIEVDVSVVVSHRQAGSRYPVEPRSVPTDSHREFTARLGAVQEGPSVRQVGESDPIIHGADERPDEAQRPYGCGRVTSPGPVRNIDPSALGHELLACPDESTQGDPGGWQPRS